MTHGSRGPRGFARTIPLWSGALVLGASLGVATACGAETPEAPAATTPPGATGSPLGDGRPSGTPASEAPRLESGWLWLADGDKLYADASRSSMASTLTFAPNADGGDTTDQPRRGLARVTGEADGWVEVETLGSGSRGDCGLDLHGLDVYRLRFFMPRDAVGEVIPTNAEAPACAPRPTPQAVEEPPDLYAAPSKSEGLQWGQRTGRDPDESEWSIKDRARVYWPDGRTAGTVAAAHRFGTAPEQVGDRLCFLAGFEASANPLRLCFDAAATTEVKPPVDKMMVDRMIAENAGVLGVLSDAGHMNSVFGSAYLDDGEISGLGGLIGHDIGAAYGAGGLGLVGTGRGGGGSGEGTIGGLGSINTGGGSTVGLGSTKSSRGSTTITSVSVTGQLEEPGVRSALTRMRHSLRYCYEKALRDEPTLSGSVAATLRVGENGRVESADVSGDFDASTRSCLERSLRRTRFGKTGRVSVRIDFKPAP